MKKRKLEIQLSYILITVASVIIWALLYFIGYFFAANLLFYLTALVLTILIYLFVSRISKQFAAVLAIFTVLVTALTFYTGFEESYCWEKGDQAEKYGSRFIIASKEDAKSLKAFGVREGTEIGSSFRTHMLCHETFNYLKALNEKFNTSPSLPYRDLTSTPDKSPKSTLTQTSAQISGIVPSDWTYKKSKYCDVSFPTPPNEYPYIEFIDNNKSDPLYRRFWQLREVEEGPKDDFRKLSILFYVADIEASGHAEGMVRVQCQPKGKYTLENAPEIWLSTMDNKDIKLISKRATNLWGKNVTAAKYKGGMFGEEEIYFVVENNVVYKIDKRSDSKDILDQDTTKQIFNNLQFLD